ncbi:hypothetical protein AHiyo6_35790, partial [Arthrobacter sp. Hiyo6]
MLRRPRYQDVQEPAPASVAAAAVQLASPAPANGDVYRYKDLALNRRTRSVVLRGSALELTRSEFDLLHALLQAAGAVCTRAELVRVVRGDYYEADATSARRTNALLRCISGISGASCRRIRANR